MTFGSRGHYAPMEALVRGMLAAGHQVAVASSPGFRASVGTPGVEYLPVGMNAADALAAFNQLRRRDVPASADAIVAGMFVDICVPAVLADMQRLLDWKPDVIVREEGEFSAPVVAELAGVPCAEHSWGPVRPRQQRDSAVAALTPIWLAHGLAPDPMCGIHRSLYFDICAPSLQFHDVADIGVARLCSRQPPSSTPTCQRGHRRSVTDRSSTSHLGRFPDTTATATSSSSLPTGSQNSTPTSSSPSVRPVIRRA